jgi:hypothetical protein
MNHYFTRDHFRNKTIKVFIKHFRKYLNLFKNDELDISNKMKSEFASQIAEKAMKTSIPGTICPKLDKEPDCKIPHLITKILADWELKCTTGHSWRGGKYSKRPGYYVLISWEEKKEDILIFAARLHMKEEDWDKSKPNKNGEEKYYATSFDKKKLLEYKNAGKAEILCGDIYHPKYIDKSRGERMNVVNLVREKINLE